MSKRCKESENRILLETANNRNVEAVRAGSSTSLKRRFTQLKLKDPKEAESMVQAKDTARSDADRPDVRPSQRRAWFRVIGRKQPDHKNGLLKRLFIARTLLQESFYAHDLEFNLIKSNSLLNMAKKKHVKLNSSHGFALLRRCEARSVHCPATLLRLDNHDWKSS
jgi:hypothetical protein